MVSYFSSVFNFQSCFDIFCYFLVSCKDPGDWRLFQKYHEGLTWREDYYGQTILNDSMNFTRYPNDARSSLTMKLLPTCGSEG